MIHQNDTISYNAERLGEYLSDSSYDYNRELIAPEPDLYSYFYRWLSKVLEGLFGNRFAEAYTEPFLIGLFIAIIFLVLWFIYRKRPELFMRSPKASLAYEVHEDSIYGVDFDAQIREALTRKDYKEASRLLYLQTLRELSDNEYIIWELYKTPTEYIYELKPENGRETFRVLTNTFLKVRYGNFDITESVYTDMKSMQAELRKEVKNER